MIELLKSGRVDNSLLCELAAHPDFPRLMADLEIYVNGVAVKQVQTVNAIVDTMSATIMKQYNPGLTDPQLRQLVAAHIDDDSFCRYVIQQDINSIALDLREAHRDDFFSVPEDTPLKGLLQAADEVAVAVQHIILGLGWRIREAIFLRDQAFMYLVQKVY